MLKRTKNYEYIFRKCQELVAFTNLTKPGDILYSDEVFIGCNITSCFKCKHSMYEHKYDWAQFKIDHILGTDYDELEYNFFCVYAAILSAARGDLDNPQ